MDRKTTRKRYDRLNFMLCPPEDFDWKAWKLRLDKLYRYHQNRRHIIALNILDNIYDEYQKGRRTIEMIEVVREVNKNNLEFIDLDVDW